VLAVRGLLVVVTVGAVSAAAISATIGVAALRLEGIIPPGGAIDSWLTWCLGDAFGVVIVAPLLLAWLAPLERAAESSRRWEAVALAGVTLLVCGAVFLGRWHLEYAVLPLLTWAAFRFDVRGAATIGAAVAVLATLGTKLGTGPFARGTVNDSLLALDAFLAVNVVVGLVIAGVVAEQRRTRAEADESERRALIGEARLRSAAEAYGIGIFDHDHRTETIYLSPEQRVHYGFGPDERVSVSAFVERVHPADRERIAAAVRRAHDPASTGVFAVEHRILTRDGTERWLSSRARTRFEGGGSTRRPVRTIGAVIDVTERVRAEEARHRLEADLRQAQKMEAIGTLAGGIAHDFKNILTVVVASADGARGALPAESPVAQDLDQILEAAERARQLVARLLAFSRREEIRPVPCEVAPVVNEAVRFLRAAKPPNVEIRARVEPGATVLMDPVQLSQVVMNLGTNAFHAMPEGPGLLEISVAAVRLEQADAAQRGLEAGPFCELLVRDTGTGIPPELLGRIFEPYFTTKEPGKGTGLGLSVLHGIVTAAGGAVGVESAPGAGTTFRVLLPVVAGPAAPAGDADREAPRGVERVLLVDDEAMVTATMGRSLEGLGYRVTARTSAEVALADLAAAPRGFDLLVTDLSMPGLGGAELVEAALRLHPGLKTLVLSAAERAPQRERLLALGVRDFLVKPVTPLHLARAVRDALDGGGPGGTGQA
jgi:PAS domain S-box-containing protein